MHNLANTFNTTLKVQTLLLLGLLLGQAGSLGAQETKATGKKGLPLQLKLVLSPGSGAAETITFSTDDSESPVKQRVPQYTKTAEPSAEPSAQPAQAVQLPEIVQLPQLAQEETINKLPEQLKTPPPAATEPKITVTKERPLIPAEIQQPPDLEKQAQPQTDPAIASAQMVEPQPQKEKSSTPAYIGFLPEFSLGAGFRRDNLNWSIAPMDLNPNVLSELTWENLDSFEITSDLRWSNSSNIYFHGKAGFGWTLSGTVIDSDYEEDDRQSEFSRSYSDAKGGTVMDGSAGLGYRFDLPLSGSGGRFQFMPMLGYSYHVQDFKMTQGRQIMASEEFGVPLGPFDDLNSYYGTIWNGPWLGFDFILGLNDRHSLSGSFGYHWISYDGEADWNLRSDFAHPVSFEHSADGDGLTASLGYRYNHSDEWFWGMDFDWRDFSTRSGEDIVYFSDGTVGVALLNEVEWTSYSLYFSIGFYF